MVCWFACSFDWDGTLGVFVALLGVFFLDDVLDVLLYQIGQPYTSFQGVCNFESKWNLGGAARPFGVPLGGANVW